MEGIKSRKQVRQFVFDMAFIRSTLNYTALPRFLQPFIPKTTIAATFAAVMVRTASSFLIIGMKLLLVLLASK